MASIRATITRKVKGELEQVTQKQTIELGDEKANRFSRNKELENPIFNPRNSEMSSVPTNGGLEQRTDKLKGEVKLAMDKGND